MGRVTVQSTDAGAGLPALETERLILRRLEVSDATVLHRLWTERDPRVPARRRLDAAGHPTVDELAAELRDQARLPASGFALLGVERRGILGSIGYCGLNPSDEAEFDAELAFELLRDVHGRGYATEAARAVVEWAASAGIRRLEATVWDWNLASRRVLQKLGFVETDREYPVTPHGRTLLTVLEL